MSFTVQKLLGNSLFRFAVGRRRELTSIDDEREMSTGPAGEFIRHRPEIFYSADVRAIRSPELPPARTLSGTSFGASLGDELRRNRFLLAFLAVGGIFVLLGLAVLAKGETRAGTVELVIGLVLLAIPLVMTAIRRRAVLQQEQYKEREREERDSRNRELLTAYTTALERLRETPSDASLALVLAENEKLDLPYAIWADTAIGTVLNVGFSTLASLGPERAAEVAALMDRSSQAAGLIAEDARDVKHALYSTVLWHYLADDRLGRAQLEVVRSIQQGFNIQDDEIPTDTSSEAQFERLRGVDHRNAPRCNTTVPLNLNEYCMYTSAIRLPDGQESTAIVTNRRLLVENGTEVTIPRIDDVTVDADQQRITIRAAELKRPLELTVSEPIYFAAMIDLATRLDNRPKSFA